MTDISRVISKLEGQKAVIEKAIEALREVERSTGVPAPVVSSAVTNSQPKAAAPSKKGQLSLEARKKIADALRKHWAARRAAAKKAVAKKA